jgi:hypothetical protein
VVLGGPLDDSRTGNALAEVVSGGDWYHPIAGSAQDERRCGDVAEMIGRIEAPDA